MNSTIFFNAISLLATTITGNNSWNSSVKLLAKVPALTHGNPSFFSPIQVFLDDREIIHLSQFSSEPYGQWLQVFRENKTTQKCHLPMFIDGPMKRLSYNKVLIPERCNHYDKKGNRHQKLLLLNTETCKYDYIYDRYLPGSKYGIFTSDDERFTLVTYGEEACQGFKWCRIYFNPFYQEIEPLAFNFGLCWPLGLKLESIAAFDGNLILTRFIDKTGAYTVRLYNFVANRTGPLYHKLFNIPHHMNPPNRYCLTNGWTFGALLHQLYHNWTKRKGDGNGKYNIITSGLSFCYRSNNKNKLRNIVHCSRAREDGTLIFKKTISYQEEIVFHHIATIPNGLILIGSNYNCNYNEGECGIIQVAVITNEVESGDYHDSTDIDSSLKPPENQLLQVKHRRYNNNCGTGLVEHVEVRNNESDGLLKVYYLCRSGDDYLFNVFYID